MYKTRRYAHKFNLIFGLLLVTIWILIVIGGCDSQETTSQPPQVYFPVQTEKPDQVLAALLPGELELDESSYLRVNGKLILWPYGYSYEYNEGEICILNEEKDTVAVVGDNVSIGGGEIPVQYVEDKIGEPLPEDCNGPYWLANPIIDTPKK